MALIREIRELGFHRHPAASHHSALVPRDSHPHRRSPSAAAVVSPQQSSHQHSHVVNTDTWLQPATTAHPHVGTLCLYNISQNTRRQLCPEQRELSVCCASRRVPWNKPPATPLFPRLGPDTLSQNAAHHPDNQNKILRKTHAQIETVGKNTHRKKRGTEISTAQYRSHT